MARKHRLNLLRSRDRLNVAPRVQLPDGTLIASIVSRIGGHLSSHYRGGRPPLRERVDWSRGTVRTSNPESLNLTGLGRYAIGYEVQREDRVGKRSQGD